MTHCPERGCPFNKLPFCPDHDSQRINLHNRRQTMIHRTTWPVVGPGYDRRNQTGTPPRPILTREDRETHRLETLLKERNYWRPIIYGYTLSYHATARLIVRQINRAAVEDTLKYPRITTKTRNAGTTKYTGTSAMCVVNHNTRQIVTIGHGTDHTQNAHTAA